VGQPYKIRIGAEAQTLPTGVSLSAERLGNDVERVLMFTPARGSEGSATTVCHIPVLHTVRITFMADTCLALCQ